MKKQRVYFAWGTDELRPDTWDRKTLALKLRYWNKLYPRAVRRTGHGTFQCAGIKGVSFRVEVR